MGILTVYLVVLCHTSIETIVMYLSALNMLIDWLGMLKMRERKRQDWKMRETEKYGTPQVHYTHQQMWHYKNLYRQKKKHESRNATKLN